VFVEYTEKPVLGRVGESNLIDRLVLFNGRKKALQVIVMTLLSPHAPKRDNLIHFAYSSNGSSGYKQTNFHLDCCTEIAHTNW